MRSDYRNESYYIEASKNFISQLFLRQALITISTVIPTCDRRESLHRILRSLAQQSVLPDEVIVVDGSTGREEHDPAESFPRLNIIYVRTGAAVCVQRNIGIRRSAGSHIFLCDDDLELPKDYVARIKEFLLQNPKANIATGLVYEKNEKGDWAYEYPAASAGELFWKFIFQQSVWYDIDKTETGYFGGWILLLMSHFYATRGNSYTLAGWPVVTQFTKPVFTTAFYGLGASVVKKEWLVASPYDELLDANGIGDNYGVALHFPELPAIHVLSELPVYHHKEEANRLSGGESYYRRGLALHYFMHGSTRFTGANRMLFVWSLLGNWAAFLAKRNWEYLRASNRLFKAIVLRNNPYIRR